MKVLYERVAGIDVHKEMVKVAIRSPGEKPWTRKTEVLEFRTFYGVLQAMGRELRRRGVTHVVMEASGIYTDPVYYALAEQDFTEVAVINPAHARALKGHKTDARDCARVAELFECGLLRGSYIPQAELREVRDLTRYRMKTVQARTSEIRRLGKALESAGIKLGSVASSITCQSATAMIESLIDGERRGGVLADLAIGRMRTAGSWPTCRWRWPAVHRASCAAVPPAPGPDRRLRRRGGRPGQADHRQGRRVAAETGLLTSVPGFGDVVAQAWLGEIGPAPHRHFASTRSWPPGSRCARGTTSAPASASTAGPGTPAPTSSRCWCRPPGPRSGSGRLQARYNRLVRRFGGQEPGREEEGDHRDRAHPAQDRLPGAQERGAVPEPGADFYTRRESPQQKQAWLERQLQKLHPDCTVTITISPAGGRLTTRRLTAASDPASPEPPRAAGTPAHPPDNQRHPSLPRHRTGQGLLPRATGDPVVQTK